MDEPQAETAKPFSANITRETRKVEKTLSVRVARIDLRSSTMELIIAQWVQANAPDALGHQVSLSNISVTMDVTSYGDLLGCEVEVILETAEI